MRKTIIYLFIACFFAGIGKTSYAQSYKNDIDIGKGAFSILQKMDTMTEDEFISIFSNTIHLYNSLSSEKITKDDYRKQYKMLKYKGKSKGIIWKNITYDWSKQYMIIDKGLNKYFGLLSIYANGKQVQIRIYSILYKGRYYIFKIQ